MILSLITVAVFGLVGVDLWKKAHFKATRRVACVALTVSFFELLLCGALDLTAYPAFSVVLMAARIAVLVCCAGARRLDAVRLKKTRRCAVWQRITAEVPVDRSHSRGKVIPMRRCA